MAHWKRFIYVVIALFSLQLTARAQETETFVHTIKQGETVYSIARTYQVSPESILKLNPTASTGIKHGRFRNSKTVRKKNVSIRFKPEKHFTN